MNKNFIAMVVFFTAMLGVSCSKDEPKTTHDDMTPQTENKLQPDSIVIELYEGHSHLKSGTEPEVGAVYWTTTSRGFHANPASEYYPLNTRQKMVYVRNNDGSYIVDKKYDQIFRIQSSPSKLGNWYGVVVKLYHNGGERMDLKFKKEGARDSIQVFYTVHDIKQIPYSIPKNVLDTDTTFTSADLDTDDSEDQETKTKLESQGLLGPYTFGYKTAAKWNNDTDPSQACYFWYFDRETDDARTTLTTPVGFRGVLAARVPFVAYSVRLRIAKNIGKKGERNSVSPSDDQLSNILFTLDIPFRNVYETPGWGEPIGDPKLISILWDKEYNYYNSEAAKRLIDTWCIHIPVLREFPQYTVKQLREWYEKDSEASFESSNFWL